MDAAEELKTELEQLEGCTTSLTPFTEVMDNGEELQPDSEAEDLHAGALSLIGGSWNSSGNRSF